MRISVCILTMALYPFLLLTAWAQPASAPSAKSGLDKTTLEAYMRHLFAWGPQIQVKVGDPTPSELPGFYDVTVSASSGNAHVDQRFYISKDGYKIVQGTVYDIRRDPFASQAAKVRLEGPRLGQPDAPIVLVEFSDFECPFCKDEAMMLRSNLMKAYPNQVRLYFKDLPLDQIHPWARMAAIAGRCIYKQNADVFWLYHDWIYGHQSEITPQNLKAKVLEFAQGKPIDLMQLNRCLETRATEEEVAKSVAEAEVLQIHSTPTILLNGRPLTGRMSWEQLRSLIDFEIQYQKANASAACANEGNGCAVRLQTPGSAPEK